jgi:hypothetical protein
MAHFNFPELFMLAAVLNAQPVIAKDMPAEEQVKITLEPYVWVPTITGTSALGQLEAQVTVKPKDFVEGFKLGGMGRVKIEQRDRFIYVDAIVVDYDNRSFQPFFGQPLRSKIRYFDFGIGVTKAVRINERTSLSLSPRVGIQHLYLTADVNGTLIVAKSDGKWWSPSAGLTVSLPVTDRLSVDLSADAAGFGLGDVDYQNAAFMLKYRLGRHWDATAGYRVAKGRFFSPGGLSIDVDGKGLMVAIAYYFGL